SIRLIIVSEYLSSSLVKWYSCRLNQKGRIFTNCVIVTKTRFILRRCYVYALYVMFPYARILFLRVDLTHFRKRMQKINRPFEWAQFQASLKIQMELLLCCALIF